MRTYTRTRAHLGGQYRGGLLIWGILIAIFGLCAIFLPHLTLMSIIFLFGVFAAVNGLLSIYTAFHERATSSAWRAPLVEGVISLIIGLLVLLWPHVTAIIVLYLIAAWAIITGIFQLVRAFRGEYRLMSPFHAIAGVAAILLGIFLLAVSPLAVMISLMWIVGLYALIYGTVQIIRSFFAPRRRIEQPEYREPEFLQ
ncbi:MAG TPA: HdeD family acid-resistance protein [Ktedonobacteraceae bacterium]|nr:HdeD family acid-resistance protein [Ktedonobacteraceae bacterium]